MMTNKTHQIADFDSIVGDENSWQILASANLCPSSWNLPDLEMTRIFVSGLRIRIEKKLASKNWPAFVDRHKKIVYVARDFLELENITQEEKLATILHEIGHIVNREPEDSQITDKTQEDCIANLFLALREQDNPSDTPAGISELYADDYARYCGFPDHLGSGLRLLYEISNNFQIQSTRERIARLEADERPLLLNLIPLPN